jgi:DMSO reductase anchor subunit
MHWTIFTILCGVWVLAVFSGNTVGGFVHTLLVIAIVVMLVKVYKDRKLNV